MGSEAALYNANHGVMNSMLGLTYAISLRLAQLFWAIFGLVIYGLLLSVSWKLASQVASESFPLFDRKAET